MVYITNIEEAQFLLIPRNGNAVNGSLTLSLRNTTENKTTSLSVELNASTPAFAILKFTLSSGLTPGEYQYQLLNGSAVVSNGLLVVLESHFTDEYNKIEQYEQYINE